MNLIKRAYDRISDDMEKHPVRNIIRGVAMTAGGSLVMAISYDPISTVHTIDSIAAKACAVLLYAPVAWVAVMAGVAIAEHAIAEHKE